MTRPKSNVENAPLIKYEESWDGVSIFYTAKCVHEKSEPEL